MLPLWLGSSIDSLCPLEEGWELEFKEEEEDEEVEVVGLLDPPSTVFLFGTEGFSDPAPIPFFRG